MSFLTLEFEIHCDKVPSLSVPPTIIWAEEVPLNHVLACRLASAFSDPFQSEAGSCGQWVATANNGFLNGSDEEGEVFHGCFKEEVGQGQGL
jgi:hypothetical protein